MLKEEAIKKIDSLEIGVDTDFRLGLSTRTICKLNEDKFEINDFVDGWNTATVDKETMIQILIGEKSLLYLNWE